jgi:hypothetical protein
MPVRRKNSMRAGETVGRACNKRCSGLMMLPDAYIALAVPSIAP